MDLEFEDLIREGKTPQEAAAIITKIISLPEVLELLVEMSRTPVGREMLAEGCRCWERYGLCAPWAVLLGPENPLDEAGGPSPELYG